MMNINGVINVLKPTGITSSDVVVSLRRKLGIKKVGHTGTLDPAAAGVLPICIGKATKLAEYITSEIKVYRAEMILGVETDTLDADGQVVAYSENLPDAEKIYQTFKQYQGRIKQQPPMYSAIKHRGKPLHELARKGEHIDIPYREVVVFENNIIRITPPNRVFFEVKCSKGTYIRSLCRDMGRTMGCGAYLSFLLRIRNGIFSIDNSWTLDEIDTYIASGELDKIVIPMDQSIPHFGAIYLEDSVFDKITNGNRISSKYIQKTKNINEPSNLSRIYCNNQFIGIGFINEQNILQMKKVLL